MTVIKKIPFFLWLLWAIAWINGVVFFAGVGGNDGWGYYISMETLIDDFDIDPNNNLKSTNQYGTHLGVSFDQEQQKYICGYTFGHSVIYAPPFWAGGIASDLWGGKIDTTKFPEDSPYHGQDTKTMVRIIFCVTWSNMLNMALLGIMFWLARHMNCSAKEAFWVVLLCWLSSPLPFYTNNMTSHVSSTLLFALAMIPIVLKSERWYMIGLLAGFATLPREANMMIGAAIGLDIARRTTTKNFVIYSCGFMTIFSFNLIQWWARNGSPFNMGTSMNLGAPEGHPPIYNMLINPRLGYLIWFPAMAFALYYMVKLCKEKYEYRPMLILSALLIVMYGFRYEYATSGFGQRFLTSMSVLWFPGMVLAWRNSKLRLFIIAGATYSTCLYLLHKAKLTYLSDTITPFEGCWITDYTMIFEYPVSEWLSLLMKGSQTLPVLMTQPLLMIVVLALPLIPLIWSYRREPTTQRK